MYSSAAIEGPQLTNNPDQIRKISNWLKEFNKLTLQEKLSMIRTIDQMQGPKASFDIWINTRITRSSVD